MTAPFPPPPFRAPTTLPGRIERIVMTIEHAPRAEERDWRDERMWLLARGAEDIETCLTAGFLRMAPGPASVTLDDPGRGPATLTVVAAGLTPAVVVVLLRYVVTLYSPSGLPEMRPETALTAVTLRVEPAGDATERLTDALTWPEGPGPRPAVVPDGPVILVRDGKIRLTGAATGAEGFLEALGALAASDALVPLGTDMGEVETMEFTAWPSRDPDGTPTIVVEHLAIEPVALMSMIRCAAPTHRGAISVHDADRDG